MSASELAQWFWPQPISMTLGETFTKPRSVLVPCRVDAMLQTDFACYCDEQGHWLIDNRIDASLPAQSYELTIDSQGAQLVGHDKTACFYGQLTLLQYLALHQHQSHWPALHIKDHPTYLRRGALIDLGRSVSNLPMLKQLVRVLARLRYNEMHLRLYDDELCNFRFEGHELGTENPFVMTLDELADLAKYAQQHHVRLVPELESWGHVGSLVYHNPHLHGGVGMYGGKSFLAGKASAALIGDLSDQVLNVLGNDPVLHLGFDEAGWYPDPTMGLNYSPEDYLLDLHYLRCDWEQRHGKAIQLRIWADHAGRNVPDEMSGRVILEPWQYWHRRVDQIQQTIDTYTASGHDWMMCVGQSQGQVRGAYKATRDFCQRAVNGKNLQGVTVALWGWNDWSRHLFTLFTGAYFAWQPQAKSQFCYEQDDELFDMHVMPKMLWWQSLSSDTNTQNLEKMRGPLVWNGRYVGGDRHGEVVAPTVIEARTFPAWQYAPNAPEHEAAELVKN